MSLKVGKSRRYYGTVNDLAYKLGVFNRIKNATRCVSDLSRLLDVEIHVGYLGKTAGWAMPVNKTYPDSLIELHEELFKEGREQDLSAVFVHEVGHVLDTFERGNTDHSSRWKKVMARLGAKEETRCHSLPYLRDSLTKLHCDKCSHTENTRKPETQAGRKCSWCFEGRMQVSKAESKGSK